MLQELSTTHGEQKKAKQLPGKISVPDEVMKQAQDLLPVESTPRPEESKEPAPVASPNLQDDATLAWLVEAGIPKDRARVYKVGMIQDGFDTPEAPPPFPDQN